MKEIPLIAQKKIIAFFCPFNNFFLLLKVWSPIIGTLVLSLFFIWFFRKNIIIKKYSFRYIFWLLPDYFCCFREIIFNIIQLITFCVFFSCWWLGRHVIMSYYAILNLFFKALYIIYQQLSELEVFIKCIIRNSMYFRPLVFSLSISCSLNNIYINTRNSIVNTIKNRFLFKHSIAFLLPEVGSSIMILPFLLFWFLIAYYLVINIRFAVHIFYKHWKKMNNIRNY